MTSTYNFSSRHLTPSEVVSDILQSYGANILLHVATIKSDVRVTAEHLKQTLTLLAEFQPALRMCITTENKGKEGIIKRFVECKAFKPGLVVVHNTDKRSWLKIAQEELKTGFDSESGPLWKLTYIDFSAEEEVTEISAITKHATPNGSAINGESAIPNGGPHSLPNGDICGPVGTNGIPTRSILNNRDNDYGYVKFEKAKHRNSTGSGGSTKQVHFKEDYEGAIMFKVHHVIADGSSVVDLLVRQLIPLLHKVITKADLSNFHAPLTTLPGVDDSFYEKDGTIKKNSLLRKSSRSKKVKRRHFHDLFRPLLFDTDNSLPQSGSLSCLLPVAITPPATREVLEKCAQHRVPVHTALLTATGTAFSILASTEGLGHALPSDIICGSPVDLREYRSIRGHQPLGQWLGYGLAKVRSRKEWIGPDEFWDEVSRVNSQINAEKPWSIFNIYQEALRSYNKSDGDISFAADLPKPHFEFYDLGNCDNVNATGNWATEIYHYRMRSSRSREIMYFVVSDHLSHLSRLRSNGSASREWTNKLRNGQTDANKSTISQPR